VRLDLERFIGTDCLGEFVEIGGVHGHGAERGCL
jgi:hypothetical protein